MKKVLILLIVLIIVFSASIVNASNTAKIRQIEQIINKYYTWQPVTAQNPVNKILGTIQWVGYAIAVGMLIYIGIKYVIASPDEKASLKGALVKYVTGALLVAAAATIVKVLSLLKR